MIKLFSLKQQKKDGEQTSKTGTQKKASAAQLRIQKGMDKKNDKWHDPMSNLQLITRSLDKQINRAFFLSRHQHKK